MHLFKPLLRKSVANGKIFQTAVADILEIAVVYRS